MKKIAQFFFSYETRPVEDVNTHQLELATFYKVFGFVVKITYEPLEQCHHSQFLGI